MPKSATPNVAADATPPTGWRERKRQQTRQRITEEALKLFLSRGFEATTLDDIATAAEISRRSFFHYFPAKEDVVFAWQDGFTEVLTEAVRLRPAHEPLLLAAQRALLAIVANYAREEALALARLVHHTPVLRARDQAKHAAMEQALGEALIARLPSAAKPPERLRAQMTAMLVIGSLRVATTAWLDDGGRAAPLDYANKAFHALGECLGELDQTVAAPRKPRR